MGNAVFFSFILKRGLKRYTGPLNLRFMDAKRVDALYNDPLLVM